MNGYETFLGRGRSALVLLAVLLVMVQPLTAWSANSFQAGAFQAGMDDSSWMVDSSIYDCRMSHEIPYYGYAVFQQQAGEASRFQLIAQSARLKAGKAALASRPPAWKPSGHAKEMGWVTIEQDDKPVMVEGATFQRLLAELFAGQELVFTRMPWYGAEQSAQVVLSPVNFRQAYQKYQDCLTGLLPVNFEQIRRTAIYFPSGSDALRAGEMTKLNNIALYVNADDSVGSFYVDGHTDSAGNRSDNLELSQRRAEVVVALLIEKGVSAEKITSRWHGERYPVETNRNAKGRDQNRRVTIRIEKVGYIEPVSPVPEKDAEALDAPEGLSVSPEKASDAPKINDTVNKGGTQEKGESPAEPSLASVLSQ